MEIALYQEEAELLHVDKQTKPLEAQARQLYMHVCIKIELYCHHILYCVFFACIFKYNCLILCVIVQIIVVFRLLKGCKKVCNCLILRKEGDSNPRNDFVVYTLSRRASSTTRASFLFVSHVREH